jgi:hypothetical protein
MRDWMRAPLLIGTGRPGDRECRPAWYPRSQNGPSCRAFTRANAGTKNAGGLLTPPAEGRMVAHAGKAPIGMIGDMRFPIVPVTNRKTEGPWPRGGHMATHYAQTAI